jgi:hypothetical protein
LIEISVELLQRVRVLDSLDEVSDVSASDGATFASDLPLSPSKDPGWLLTEEGVRPAREREVESLFAIGNGYIGARASIAEGGRFSRPSIFAAGIYVADGELGPRLAALPPWLHVEVTVEGRRLSLDAGRVLAHRRRLDLRQGVLWREWRQQDPSGRITRLTFLQLACLADRHLLLQSMAITAENYAGEIGAATRLGPAEIAATDMESIAAESGAMLLRVSDTEVEITVASELLGEVHLEGDREVRPRNGTP